MIILTIANKYNKTYHVKTKNRGPFQFCNNFIKYLNNRRHNQQHQISDLDWQTLHTKLRW